MSETPNYKVIELQVENEKLKDDIIELQRKEIERLNAELLSLKTSPRVSVTDDERDQGSHMIAPDIHQFGQSRIRTISELAAKLEEKSRVAAELKKEE